VAQRDAYRDTLLANGIETVIVDDGPPPPDNRAPNGTLNAKTVREHLGTGSTVGLFSLTDEDNDPVSISLKNDAGGRFILDGNRLKVKDHTKIDFEASPAGRTLTVVVEISDGRTTVEKTFTIGVRNVFIDNVTGTAADETIYGGASTDILRGEGGNDRLVGGQGADNLWGGLGNDELTGGFGKDAFVFNQAASATNVDTITDFAVNDDLIRLSKSAFTAFSTTASGVLSGSAFALGTQAQDADDRIVYHQESGTLYYDADGVGGASAIIFAKLSNATKPLLSNTHFIIF
jgi:Ca2+-binding RTX toxin-like protein